MIAVHRTDPLGSKEKTLVNCAGDFDDREKYTDDIVSAVDTMLRNHFIMNAFCRIVAVDDGAKGRLEARVDHEYMYEGSVEAGNGELEHFWEDVADKPSDLSKNGVVAWVLNRFQELADKWTGKHGLSFHVVVNESFVDFRVHIPEKTYTNGNLMRSLASDFNGAY